MMAAAPYIFKRFSPVLILFSLILFSSAGLNVHAQALTGTTGYYNIPSADLYPDKTIYFGSTYLDNKYLDYTKGKYEVLPIFINVTYLPFAEFQLRFSRPLNLPSYKSTNGDRMASGRIRLLKEGKYRPAVLLGLQNFFSTISTGEASHFNSTYLVITKNLHLPQICHNIGLTAGYGSDYFASADYQFIGLFYGIKINPLYFRQLELFFEYDADKFNTGARLTVLKHLVLIGGLEGLDEFSGGLAFTFRLR